MPKKQLGKNKYIRLGWIAIPVGIFVEFTGQADIAVSVSRFIKGRVSRVFMIMGRTLL